MKDILIVEDDKDDLFFLTRALEGYRGNLVCCEDAEHALAIFKSDRFGAVLCDLNLRGMDGIEFILRLRLMSSEVLIQVLTGAEDPVRRAAAISAGATGFLRKPITKQDVEMITAQIEAKTAAFKRGKRFANWRMKIGGAIGIAGTCLQGSGFLLTQFHSIPSAFTIMITIAGTLMLAVGFGAAVFFGADRKTLEEQIQKLMEKK